MTSGNGNYLFQYLVDGNQVRYDTTYCVVVDSATLPPGYASTTGGHSRTVNPWGSATPKLDVDFGYQRTSSLGIAKTVNPTGSVSTGQALTYQVVVSNPNSFNQTGIVITDSLPAGVSYTASSTTANGTAATSKTVKDTFASQSYSRQDGPDNWETNWIESDPSGSSASSGHIYVSSSSQELRLGDDPDSGQEPSIAREVDLSGYSSATLSFDWNTSSEVDADDGVVVEISSNGGSSYTILESFVGYSDANSGTRSYNIDGYVSADTKVRFRVILNYDDDDNYFAVDNVQIAATGVATSLTTKDNNTSNATPDLANGAPPNLVASADGYALKPNQTMTVTFQATVTASSGTLVNTAFAKSNETPNPVQSSASNSVATGGQIGDRVWYDLDGQGDQDGGEVGINGVTVHLYNGTCGPAGPAIQTKTTSGDGGYLFTGLPAGDYCVALDTATLPAPGYIHTNSGAVSNPKSVTLTTGQSRLDVDFGYMANQCLPTIDFETDAAGNPLVKGQVIDNEWAAWGVTVSATANPGGTGPAMIFDSAVPTGGDTDLGTPNQSFGGPGVGAGGASGMPGANAVALGKVLIISEDGSSNDPDDNANGGVIKFTFGQPLRVDQVEILDIDDDEAGGTVKAYDAVSGGTLLATGDMLGLGDNSFQIVPLNATGVRRLEVTFPSSGAVPAITFCGTPPVVYTLGDRIWNDTSEDGVQDTGEPGIGNVKLELLVGATLAETKTTDASGIYTFTNLPAGTYTVRVAASNFNSGGPLAGYVYSPKDQGGDDTKDSDFDSTTGTVSVNLTGNDPTIDGGFYEPINLCYAVADSTTSANDGHQKDTLAFLNRLTGATAAVGSGVGNTNRFNIEAIAFQPGGSVLYAADAGQLGILNLTTGAFTATSSSFGSGSGSAGSITFDDVDGLTFDLTTGFLYGTHRRGSDPDVLFRINPATGQRVNDAFGSDEYVVVPAVAGLEDVDDIAVDPVTGMMYAIVNNGSSSESRLVTLNKATGAATSIGPVQIGGNNIQDIEGLAFFNDGKLYGSSGKSGPTTNALYQINIATAVATLIGAFTEPLRDFEGLECLSAPAAIVVEKSTNGEDADDLPGPTLLAGSTVTWTYYVVNTGGVTLNNVVLTDDKEGTITCPQSSLASGASMTCTKNGIAITGQYSNTATVTGVRVDNGQTVQDTDPSHYNGIGSNPDYVITKVNNTDPDLHGVRVGEAISFTIRITNTGDVPIVILPLRDTYVDGILTYIGATPVHSSAAPGQVDWDDLTSSPPTGFGVDLAVGQSFALLVEFVGTQDTTALPGGVTINTATVRNAFYDPDGPGGIPPQSIPDKSATAPAKIVAPTAVALAEASASYADAQAILRWRTANESDLVGFHIYRSVDSGAAVRLTEDRLIAAQKPGQSDGASYDYTDTSVETGKRYIYALEFVGTGGPLGQAAIGEVLTGARLFLPTVGR